MKSGQIFLLVIAALILGFLASKIVRRMRVKKIMDAINSDNTSTNTNTQISTSTSTSTSTGTSTSTVTESSERSNGCVPFGNYNGAICPPNKKRKLVNGVWMCC